MTTGDEDTGLERNWKVYETPETDHVERESHDLTGHRLATREEEQSTDQAPQKHPALWSVAGAAVAGGVVGLGLLFTGGPEPAPEETVHQPMLDATALETITDWVEGETGGTEVLHARFYTTEDVEVTLPVEEGEERADVYRWDGTDFDLLHSTRITDGPLVDLGKVDPEVLVELDEHVRDIAGGPYTGSYASYQHPPAYQEEPRYYQLSVRNTNRSGYVIWADLDGHIYSDLEVPNPNAPSAGPVAGSFAALVGGLALGGYLFRGRRDRSSGS